MPPMTIDELLHKLTLIKEQHGNILVGVGDGRSIAHIDAIASHKSSLGDDVVVLDGSGLRQPISKAWDGVCCD